MITRWKKNESLARLLDLYTQSDVESVDKCAPACLRRPEVQKMLWDLRGSVDQWLDQAKAMGQEQTVVHGDFHRGQLFAKVNGDGTTELAVTDWSCIGTGHLCMELVVQKRLTLLRLFWSFWGRLKSIFGKHCI